ncbi:MAG: hypothetical protein JSV24_04135, partial [Bacteroidales bacterium]
WIGMILLLAVAGILVKNYLDPVYRGKSIREAMIVLNNEYVNHPHVTVTQCDLDLTHLDEEIEVTAGIRLMNHTDTVIPEYVFTLNPGLKILEVARNGSQVAFERDLHLLRIQPEEHLLPGKTDSLHIRYQGQIDPHACYLDIDESLRSSELRLDMLSVHREYSFVTPEYLLLTAELLWYPEAGVNYCSTIPGYHRTSFVNFSLTVSSDKHLEPFSQGQMTRMDDDRFRFVPEHPLSRVSLVIGKYVRRTIMCDSVEYNLLTLEGHDYFEPYLNELGDTLCPVIRELKQDYEWEINLPYLFPRFSLVEVPIQFTSYPRFWTMSQETVQPEIVLLPEMGLPIWQADFHGRLERGKRNAERNNQVVSDKELQAQMLENFIREIVTTGNQETWFYGENIGYGRSAYSVYPNYCN